MNKKLGYLILGICAVGVITFGIYSAITFSDKEDKEINTSENNLNLETNSKNNLMFDLNINNLKFYKKLSKDEKIEIAKDLFDDYINENRTDWSTVKSQKLNRKPVNSLTDYRIGDINVENEEGYKFTVSVSYDIQYTNESNMWVAGNGVLKDNNWIVDKFALVDIEQVNDKYVITNMGCG